MSNSQHHLFGVISDDFTGAVDAGVEFVRAGFATRLVVAPTTATTSHVQVINTDSRDGDAQTARERTAAAAMQMRGRRVFKKIDSTMRGHLGDEIVTILDVLGQRKAVVCPAAIEAGRTVRAGQLWLGDVPLHHSEFARDPRWPATTAALSALIRAPTTHLSLDIVRARVDLLADAIARAPTAIVTVDACAQEDLARVSQAIVLSDSMPCGALGLARGWARCYSDTPQHLAQPISPSHHGPILVVAGSRHPQTRAQLQHLRANSNVSDIEVSPFNEGHLRRNSVDQAIRALLAGNIVILRTPLQDSPGTVQRALVECLGDITRLVCEAVQPGGLVLTGGETASAVNRQLGTDSIHIVGEVEVGVPWGRIDGGIAADCLVVTKAGGFGSVDTLLRAVNALHGLHHCER